MSDSRPSEDLADLYDNAPCGYVSLSPGGYIVKANKTFTNWIGKDERELLGAHFHDVLSFGGRIAFETHLAPLLRLQGFVHEIALDLIAGEEKIPIIANAAERRDADGGHLFTRLTMFKAVDRRTFERSLIDARAKAEAEADTQRRSAALRDQFTAVLGHDLRNPLAAIEAGIAMLSRSDKLDKASAAIVREMDGSARRAHDLIDSVMDFAHGTLGQGMQLEPQEGQNLLPTLEQVLRETRRVMPDRQFDAELRLLDPVDCDPARIAQLAANLLTNAAVHGAPDQPVILSAHTDDLRFRLSVSNAGDPIDEETLRQLFQPFFRGKQHGNRSGLGLGLFIVNEIASAHGGTMDIQSDSERTCFSLDMPRRTATQADDSA